MFDFGKDKNININHFLETVYNKKLQTGQNFYITGYPFHPSSTLFLILNPILGS